MKVERITERIAEACAGWHCVEGVSLGEHRETDLLDPYFLLSYDVYHSGTLPDIQTRRLSFVGAGAYETSLVQSKDRFLLEGIPVRLAFRRIAEVEEMLDGGKPGLSRILQTGTYPLYRIDRGTTVYDRSGWLGATRSRLSGLPEETWEGLREVFSAKMEHCHSDLGAAVRAQDLYFALESSAGFASGLVSLLFALNRRFEPSHRAIESHLRELRIIPDDFFGRWEIFLRADLGISGEQRFEVAGLLAKSVLSLK